MDNLLNEYFDITYLKRDDVIHKVSIRVKKTKLPNIKTNANGATEQWYIDKFGKSLGSSLYEIRRRFNSTNKIVEYLVNTDISDNDKQLLLNYTNTVNTQRKVSNIKRYSDPNFKKKFIEIVNKPERIEKISNAAKRMWKSADSDVIYRMLNSSKRKNYRLGKYDMNYIEYQLALLLTELNIRWDYEPVIKIKNKIYRPDFVCLDYNLIIECYGDFWHANPKYFENRKYTHKTRTVESVRTHDKLKQNEFESTGYMFEYFWEDDIINNIKQIKNKICGLKKK